MYSKKDQLVLEQFANQSDKLFELGIITTDSFTGEIGEYVVCKQLGLNKTQRVTKAVDAISNEGKKYQIKAKVISGNSLNYNISNLDTKAFHNLAVIYFDKDYSPLKILIIPSRKIKNGEISITASILNSGIIIIDKTEIKIPKNHQKAIKEFAITYQSLKDSGIIRSSRVVGDIGEFFASKKLNLILSENKNEKGIDAKDKKGDTYEIKTRRVYESERRVSKNRRINGLVGKDAKFLIVVVLDRSFKCVGMWLMPMKNIVNPTSPNLRIVNTTPGVKTVVPSKISWLQSGENKSVVQKERTLKVKIIPNKKKVIQSSTILNREIEKNTVSIEVPNYYNIKISSWEWFIIFMLIVLLIQFL